MKLTNRMNLPQAVVDAISNDPYSRGQSDISVTQLIDSPRIRVLEARHADDIVEDASERVASLIGQGFHLAMERANKSGWAEQRHTIEVEGWKLSGGIDLFDQGVITDYKVTHMATLSSSSRKHEWEAQLNCYAHMLRVKGHEVTALQALVYLRDWYQATAARGAEMNYPKTQIIVVPLPLWPADQAAAYVRERVILHQQAELSLPKCGPDELWARAEQWALMKVGGKKATKLYSSKEDALAHASTDPKLLYVELREGGGARCRLYCRVSNWCDQYQATLRAETSQKEAV